MFSILGNVAQTLGAGGFGPIDDDVDDGLSTMIYPALHIWIALPRC